VCEVVEGEGEGGVVWRETMIFIGSEIRKMW
jgi:hypothetical protein